MMVHVTDNGAVSEAFAVINGMKQGCPLAPTVFGIMFAIMLLDVYRNGRPRIDIAYRTDDRRLDTLRMRASSGPQQPLCMNSSKYDCALNVPMEATVQRSMDHLASDYANVGLNIKTYKTLVIRHPGSSAAACARRIPLHCPHHLRTSSHRIDLLDRMRIHDSGIHNNINTPRTPHNSPIPSTINSSSSIAATTSGITTATNSASSNLSCPHCRRTRTARIGLARHLKSIAQRLARQFLEHQHNPPHSY
ncbi:hypothetical protein SprV_0401569600 [Sparganum proliferum]